MVKKKSGRAEVGRIPVRMDSASIEEQTMERVDRTMATIGKFLSKWDAAGRKPDAMALQVTRIKQFYDALGAWQKMALRAKGRETGRVQRLRDFVLICRIYS
jgi:predicted MarR family transcription regulator